MHFKTHPQVVYGVDAIAYATDVLDESGKPNRRKMYNMLENGYVAGAKKMGNTWALSVPTFRRDMHGDVADLLSAQTIAEVSETESDEAAAQAADQEASEDEARRGEEGEEEEAEAEAPEAT